MQVYTHTKPSIPDLRVSEAFMQSAPAVVHFDSLQSMPLSFDWLPAVPSSSAKRKGTGPQLDMAAVQAAGIWLREHLQLRLFGFDVIVDTASGMLLVSLLPVAMPFTCHPGRLHCAVMPSAFFWR